MVYLLVAEGTPNPLELGWLPLVTTIIVFSAFFAVLKFKVWTPIQKGLDDREQKIRAEIESAEEARARADAALKEYEDSLATAREEASSMIAQARQDARTAGDELRKRNETELAELKQQAGREIEQAKQAAIVEIHAEAAMLGSAVASKILQREISAADQQQLVEESLRELAGA